jgi:hypothetical protein
MAESNVAIKLVTPRPVPLPTPGLWGGDEQR